MATIVENKPIANPQADGLQKDLLNLMLKKAGLKYDDLINSSIKKWVGQNLDLLDQSELERYRKIIL
jgi:hypothetical protein